MIDKIGLALLTLFGIGHIKYAPGTVASFVTCLIYYPLILIKINFIYLLIIFLILLIYSIILIDKLSHHFKEKDPKEIVIDEFFGQLIPLSVIYYYFTIYLKLYAKMKVAHNVSIKREVFSFIGDDISYTYAFYIIIAFMLFRAFDILKPFPTNYIDNKIKNNFGIMSDDLLAGIFTAIIIAIPMIILS